MNKKISRDTAQQYIYESNGQIFSVTFRKKNGEIRHMNCRRGVSKYVTGAGLKFNPESRGLVGDGQIFSVTFRKKNGEIRHMNCRRGVSKYVTGAGLKFNPESRGLVGVFDMQKHDYRFINLETLQELRCKGDTYSVEQ